MAPSTFRNCCRGRRYCCRRNAIFLTVALLTCIWTLHYVHQHEETATPVTYLGCYQTEVDADGESVALPNSTATAGRCVGACKRRGYYYALLRAGGVCSCSHFAPAGRALASTSCGAPCAAGDAEQTCGGRGALSAYVVRVPDGWLDWTPWMRLEATDAYSRYRGCNRELPAAGCLATFEKKLAGGDMDRWEKDAIRHYVGCFSMEGLPEGTLMENDWPEAIQACLTMCSWRKTPYAAIRTIENSRRCLCPTNLLTSLPMDTCYNLYGLQVFSATKFNNTLQLNFGALPRRKKVLLVDHFWSGAFQAPLLLSTYPGAFHTHEPDSLVGSDDGPADFFTIDKVTGEVQKPTALSSVLSPYFDCDMYRITGRLLKKYPEHGGKSNSGYSSYEACRRLFFSYYGTARCLPVLQESCLRSAAVTAKITWRSSEAGLEDFMMRRADVDVIQLVRDPRNTIAMQNSRGAVQKNSTALRAQSLCSGILSLSVMLEAKMVSHRVGTLLYEDLLLAPAQEAAYIYKYLGLPASKEFLGTFSKWYRDTFSWSSTLDNATRKIVDNECSLVYERFFSQTLSTTVISRRAGDRLHAIRESSRGS